MDHLYCTIASAASNIANAQEIASNMRKPDDRPIDLHSSQWAGIALVSRVFGSRPTERLVPVGEGPHPEAIAQKHADAIHMPISIA